MPHTPACSECQAQTAALCAPLLSPTSQGMLACVSRQALSSATTPASSALIKDMVSSVEVKTEFPGLQQDKTTEILKIRSQTTGEALAELG